MSDREPSERGERSSLQKIQVACRTCGVSESYYSNLSVQQFKSKHRGHDVVVLDAKGMPSKAPDANPAPEEEKSFQTEIETKPPTREEDTKTPLERELGPKKSLEREAGTRISRVIVDLVTFPALRDSVFRVRGFKDDGEEAFVATSRFENSAKVREMLEGGEYVDYDFSGLRYVWESEAIEYEGEAREKLGVLPEKVAEEARPPEPEQESEPPVRVEDLDDSTVARTNEILFGGTRIEETDQTGADRVSSPPSAPAKPREKPESPAPRSLPRPTREQRDELELTEPPAPQRPPPRPEAKVEEKRAAETTPAEAATPPEEQVDSLLVSKTWYIQGGEGNKKEAVRISKVLKAFRWKVEPVYTIGVILEDILSIETSKNQVSRHLINRIEDAGYKLTAVTEEQGKLVAWFKKAEPESPPTKTRAAAPNAPAEEEGPSTISRVPEENEANESVASSLDDSDAGLDSDLDR